MHENCFICLGTSSGLQHPNRATSGYILKTGQSLTFIDCGGAVVQSFQKTNLDPLNIDRIFISHTHADHVCELPLLIQLLHLKRKNGKVEIFLPDEFVEIFKKMLNAMYLFEEKLPFEPVFTGYVDGFKYSNDFEIEAIGNRHFINNKEIIERNQLPNKMQSHSFKINCNGKKLFYTGDLLDLDDLKGKVEGCDFVITEVNHIDNQDFFEFAKIAQVGKFIITHLGDDSDIEKLIIEARKHDVQNYEIAEDRMIIPL